MNIKTNTYQTTLWTKNFIFLNISFFLIFSNISFFYLYPLALKSMGSGHDLTGWIMGMFSIAAVLSRPFMGKMTSRYGEMNVIMSGLLVCTFASTGYVFISTLGTPLILVRIIHGTGFSAFISGSFSIAARLFPSRRRGEAFSITGVALTGAVATAPPLGEFLITTWSFNALYGVAALFSLLSLIAAYLAIKPLGIHSGQQPETNASLGYIELLKNKPFFFLLVSTLLFAHCQATIPNFIALLSSKNNMTIGPFFCVSNLSAIIVLLTMGKLIDTYGKLPFMKLAFPAFSIGILLIPLLMGSYGYLLSAVLYGIGVGFLFPAHNALAAGYGSQIDKPAIMSLFTTVYDSGFITGTVISGWFAYNTSLETLFIVTGSIGLLGFLVIVVSPIKRLAEQDLPRKNNTKTNWTFL